MRLLIVTALAAAILYGSTYQQFRFFSLENPGGAADAIHYVDMTRGDLPNEPEIRHYRWLTPAAARLAMPLAGMLTSDEELSIRLAFYLVNFSFSLLASVALFRSLQAMQFSFLLSLIGVAAYASSRATVLVTGTPMADAAYFCAIAVLVWLTLERRTLALAVVLPLLVLTKETIIPFLLLPLLTDMRKTPALWAGLAAAVIAFVISGRMVAGYYSGHDASMAAAILEHAKELGPTLARLFTFSGIHDLQNGFSLLLPMSIVGAWLHWRSRSRQVPAFVVATVPLAFGLALLSGNFGRMLFAAFPAVIAFALVAIERAGEARG